VGKNVGTYKIYFDDERYLPLEVPKLAVLPDYLTTENSPVVFGCCQGMCGSCLSEVEAVTGVLPTPNIQESETLALFVPERDNARLVCQLRISQDIRIKSLHLK
jgi:ferredoxin